MQEIVKYNRPRVFVDGDSGTTGLRVVERLSRRDDIELITLPPSERRDVTARQSIMNAADVAILCLPDGVARKTVDLANSHSVRIIDASAAHRTEAGWIYGMPEYSADQKTMIHHANRVSNPGCYATGTVMLVAPLVRANVLPPDAALTIYGVSGYSGGGRELIAEYESEGGGDGSPFYMYGLSQDHKHLEEMRLYSMLSTYPIFAPSVGRFRQGMIIAIPLHRGGLSQDVRRKELIDVLIDAYRDAPFVEVAEKAIAPDRIHAAEFADCDSMRIEIYGDASDERFLLIARYDNLGKGASGTAIQNLNIMLGFPESTGLVKPE